jgi:hypothetical protein
MTKKRRNCGRNRHGRGHTHLVDCSHCMCKPPKDKAVGRFMVKNMVDSGAMNDLRASSVFESKSRRLGDARRHRARFGEAGRCPVSSPVGTSWEGKQSFGRKRVIDRHH